jgi:pimeloyl-ACP methyl ester carboxylesterase
MESLTAPGLLPLELGALPPPDRTAEPAGFVVASDDGNRIHFLDWGPARATGVREAAAPDGARPGDRLAAAGDAAAPGVLLVPGLASTAWSWVAVARRLTATARVVAMDLRGHGLSDSPTEGYGPNALAGDAIAVGEGTGLLTLPGEREGPPLLLAGIGYGSVVAAWAARALGARCAGLVLVDGGWEDLATTTEATPEEWLTTIEEPPEVLGSMKAWLADRAAFDPSTWDADEEWAARSQVVETAAGRVRLAVHPHALAGSVRALWAYEPAGVLSAVEAPIVALVAQDDDGSRTAALGEVARRRLEAGRSPIRTAAFPGRGHNLARHEPGAVAAAVLAVATGATMRP